MKKRRINENETKLTVLLALREIGMVTDHQLLMFVTVCNVMNWFDMKLGLLDLEDEKLVIRQAHPAGFLYEVTDAGHYCLKQFAGRIPVSKRETIRKHAPEWKRRFMNSLQSPAEMICGENGQNWLQLRVIEENAILMELTVLLPEKTEVSGLEKRWMQAAPQLYRKLLQFFGNENAGTETVFLEHDTMALTLCLTGDAEKCREKWPEAIPLIRDAIGQMLSKDEH